MFVKRLMQQKFSTSWQAPLHKISSHEEENNMQKMFMEQETKLYFFLEKLQQAPEKN